MKITVNNEQEAELIKNFLIAAHEFSISSVLEIFEDKEDRILTSDQYRAISEGIFANDFEITIDPKEKELCVEDLSSFVGTCTSCGKQTEGLVDENHDVSYVKFLYLTSEESRKAWLCEECSEREH